VNGWRQHWIAPLTVVGVAAVLGLAARTVSPAGTGWAATGAALAGTLAVVAGSSYRGRRDPALLLLTAGAAGMAAGWACFTAIQVYGTRRPGDGPFGDGLRALESYTLLVGLLALTACLASMVPWRDRRGRPPLQVTTVFAAVGLPILVAFVALYAAGPQMTDLSRRIVAALIAVVALVAAVRSTTRGGWYQWVGGGAFAVAIAMAGVFIGVDLSTDNLAAFAYYAWFTIMPSVAVFLLLFGVLTAQRADATRQRRASDRAMQVMEGRAEIASIVAHDVRGPAGTIRSVAGSLRTSYERLGDPERLEFVGMIEAESQRLLRVADQMSLGLKTDAGTLAYEFVERDLEGPVLQALPDSDPGSREVRVAVDDVRAPVDGRWVTEATRQGLDNAMKFSPPDSPIDLRVRRANDDALIEIEDRGPGVPDELHDRVFEKFCRWRPPGYEDKPGSGLGLFIVRSIAREHDGDATIVNRPDGGTILQIRLPLEGAK